MDSHHTFPGTERTPAAVVAELQYGPTMVSGPYRKRNDIRDGESANGALCSRQLTAAERHMGGIP